MKIGDNVTVVKERIPAGFKGFSGKIVFIKNGEYQIQIGHKKYWFSADELKLLKVK